MADNESRRAGAEITALAHAIEDLCRNSSGEMTASACLLVLMWWTAPAPGDESP